MLFDTGDGRSTTEIRLLQATKGHLVQTPSQFIMNPPYGGPRPVAPSGNQMPIPQPWNIYNFYAAPAKSDPWIPTGLIQSPVPHDQPSNPFNFTRQRIPQNQNNYLEYGNAASPSDCTTVPGDSGYGGSRPTYSIASASAHGDDAVLDSQVGHVMGECHTGAGAASFVPRSYAQSVKRFRCEDCNAWLKSQGELK